MLLWGGEVDFFIFLAPENCDRVKEFKHAYKQEMGEDYPYGEIFPSQIFEITTAYNYREEQGGYDINLVKD